MRCLAIVHQRDAGPGVFAEAIAERGAALDTWHIAEGGEAPDDPHAYDAVLSFGASANPDQDAELAWMRPEKELLGELLRAGVPLLGACLGCQLLGDAAGAPPRRSSRPEIGWFEVELTADGAADPVLGPLAPSFNAFEWHSYEVPLPPSAVALAESPVCLQAWRAGETAWGIQFHAEVAAEDAERWIARYDVDADAVRNVVDPVKLLAETQERLAEWNRLGRELCGRFLDVVAARSRSPLVADS